MERKLTPSQRLAGFAATLAVCFTCTAFVWKWPESGNWVLGSVLVLAAVFLFSVYRAERKAERNATHPPD